MFTNSLIFPLNCIHALLMFLLYWKTFEISKLCWKEARDFLNCCPFNWALIQQCTSIDMSDSNCLRRFVGMSRNSKLNPTLCKSATTRWAINNGSEVSGDCDIVQLIMVQGKPYQNLAIHTLILIHFALLQFIYKHFPCIFRKYRPYLF